MDAEKCLSDLGGDNKWILAWFFLTSYMKSLPCVFSMYSFQFTAVQPETYHCSIPENASMKDWIPQEFVNGEWTYSSCRQFQNSSKLTIVPCQKGYNYTLKYFTTSIVTEWELLCDRAYLNAISTSSFFVMSFIGSIISCNLADKYGRKKVLLLAFSCLNITEFLQAFVNSIYILIVLKLLAGIFQQGCYICGFTMTIELFALKNRSNACLVDCFSWTFSCLIMIIYIYFIREWRNYFLWTSLTMMPFVIVFYFLPESIRWQLNKGKIKEALVHLKNAAKYSNPPLKSDHFDEMYKSQAINVENPPIYNITFYFKEFLLLRYQIINIIIWFTAAMTYYGLQIKVVNLGNPFLNFFLSALVEIPANIFCYPIANKYGRKLTIGITHFLVCMCIVAGYLLYKNLVSPWYSIVLLLIGKMLNTGIFNLIFMHVCEFFPTTLRTTAVGISSAAARIGASVGAFLFQIQFRHDSIPFIFIIVCCFTSGIIVFCLPETYKKKMPTTIEEIKEWVSGKSLIGVR